MLTKYEFISKCRRKQIIRRSTEVDTISSLEKTLIILASTLTLEQIDSLTKASEETVSRVLIIELNTVKIKWGLSEDKPLFRTFKLLGVQTTDSMFQIIMIFFSRFVKNYSTNLAGLIMRYKDGNNEDDA